jgi:hypothetical protein
MSDTNELALAISTIRGGNPPPADLPRLGAQEKALRDAMPHADQVAAEAIVHGLERRFGQCGTYYKLAAARL